MKAVDKDSVDKLLADQRRRNVLRAFFRARVLEHLKHSVPIKGKVDIKPDIEYSERADTKKARLGIARVKITEEVFPNPERVSVRDLMQTTPTKQASTMTPRLKRLRPIRTEGSYYGLKYATACGSRGSYISYTTSKNASNRIALIPTIISKLIHRYDTACPEDLKFELRAGKRRLLLTIILDASESMQAFIPTIALTLLRFHEKAWKLRSLIGLISVQENTARTLVYPTTNINRVIGGFLQVEFWGRTPLALGLLKAYRLILSARIKFPDIVPRVLLFSDGLANIPLRTPIDKNIRDYFESDAQADVIAVARLLARRNIKMIVVNPWHIDHWPAKYIISPSELLKIAAKITGGMYLGFSPGHKKSLMFPPRLINIDDATTEELANIVLHAIFKSID